MCAQKINWHAHTYTHLHTCFPPLTIFYLLVNVPNYSVKHRQRFVAWHAYWNGNATISKWKVFRSLASKWIYSWQFTLHTQDYTNERVKRWCVCVAFHCFHARDSCPGEKGPRFWLPTDVFIIQKKRTWFGFVMFSCSSVSTSCHRKNSGVCYKAQPKYQFAHINNWYWPIADISAFIRYPASITYLCHNDMITTFSQYSKHI